MILIPTVASGVCPSAKTPQCVCKREHEIALQYFREAVFDIGFGYRAGNGPVLLQYVVHVQPEIERTVFEELIAKTGIPQQEALVEVLRKAGVQVLIQVGIEHKTLQENIVEPQAGIVIKVCIVEVGLYCVLNNVVIAAVIDGEVEVFADVAAYSKTATHVVVVRKVGDIVDNGWRVHITQATSQAQVAFNCFYRETVGQIASGVHVSVEVYRHIYLRTAVYNKPV